jgi:hypothetical protein
MPLFRDNVVVVVIVPLLVVPSILGMPHWTKEERLEMGRARYISEHLLSGGRRSYAVSGPCRAVAAKLGLPQLAVL